MFRRSWTVWVVVLVSVLGINGCSDTTKGELGPTAAGSSAAGADTARAFYVRWRPEAASRLRSQAAALQSAGGEVLSDLTPKTPAAGIGGMIVRLTPAQAATLAGNPDVAYVEPDIRVHATGPIWNLDRVDQRNFPLDQRFAPMSGGGRGVQVIIFDTGIHGVHQEFGGRVGTGWSGYAGGTDDCNGHGTHVAGTAAGATVGLAASATLIPYRVLDCNGSGSTLVLAQAMNAILAARAAQPAPPPMVINMSLGTAVGQPSQALDDAVRAAVAAGITVVVAAGNDNGDACLTSPARVPVAITVGASSVSNLNLGLPVVRDVPASFSNWGSCVTLFAPGVSITSADWRTTTGYLGMSGTSMAAPHVTGAVALLLTQTPTATPAAIKTALLAQATANAIDSVKNGSPNRLLYSGAGGTPPATATPVALKVTPATPLVRVGTSQAFTVQDSLSDGTLRAATGVSWTTSGGTISAAGVLSAPATSGTVTVTASRAALRTSVAVRVVKVTGFAIAPKVDTLYRGAQRRFTGTLTLEGGQTAALTTIPWATVAGGTIGTDGLTYTAGTQLGQFSLKATDPSGLSATATVVVRNRTPTAVLVQQGACSGRTCLFSATGTTDDLPTSALTLGWSINGVLRASGSFTAIGQVAITFGAAGTYTIGVTATDGDRASSTATVTVRVP